MTLYITMGVSGCGKSTIGRAAAKAMEIPFFEGDDFHSDLAKAKMASGVSLTENDRAPWIDRIIDGVRDAAIKDDAILACSALSKLIRKRLRAELNGNAIFFHLHGDLHILKRRLAQRKNHFFDPTLLASQFAALEMPNRAITLDIGNPISLQVKTIERHILARRK